MTSLKLCECGGIPEVRTWEIEEDDEGEYTIDMYFVECTRCHKRSLVLELTEEDAITLWNRSYAHVPKQTLEEEII